MPLSTRYAAAGEKGDKGSWWDLCAGPHVQSTGQINPAAISLDSVAGAYWRGDETKAQLQRIYGTAWETKDQLKAWKELQIEAARR
jgi:threonyl-tRNA synthetase